MICTIVTEWWKGELMFGIQQFTHTEEEKKKWNIVPRFYDVPESLIDEIRTCPTEVIQSVISKIKAICPEIM